MAENNIDAGQGQRGRDGDSERRGFDVRDGKVTRWHDFGSREKALDAVGLRG